MMKKLLNSVFGRVLYTAIFIVLQAMVFVAMFLVFKEYVAYFYTICIVISIWAVMHIINNNSNPAYKMAWIIPIMLLPIFGGLFYLVFGKHRLSKRERSKMMEIEERYNGALRDEKDSMDALHKESEEAFIQASYIKHSSNAFVYENTSTEYFPLGEDMFKALLIELKKAEKFIFLEYFIVNEGKMWNTVLSILEEKVKEGVDVRFIYDDFGCMFTLPSNYARVMEAKGIKTCVFNKFTNIFSPRFNNRDHRKICVIDGNVGFTGGINMADEYINEYEKYGHWKDTAVMLKGKGVWSLTVMFLSLWDYLYSASDDFSNYMPEVSADSDGFVQPFMDTPLDEENTGETVYMNIINRAKKYVYITTPYLIIDNEMITAMTTAAKSGIDVRIITPHIADKKAVHAVTRSHYPVLLEAGVRIYEYTPGFIHSKTFVSDDEYGVVGTINLDYRSLYLHHECAVWMYKSKAVLKIKEDYLNTLEKCHEIKADTFKKKPLYKKFILTVLRVFAPLL